MAISKNQEPFVPEWRKEVEIISQFTISMTGFCNKHLQLNKPEIFEDMHNYIESITKHGNDVRKFRYLLDAVIKNKFIEKKLWPDKEYFHNQDFRDIVNNCFVA